MHRRAGTAGVVAALCMIAGSHTGLGQSSEEFVPLFDGTLSGWVIENTDANNFTVVEGVLRAEGPNGWLRSERQYGDFVLRVEFRFATDEADSGVFVRAAGSAPFMRGWPNNSYQVQIRNPTTPHPFFPPVGGIFRHGMPDGQTHFDREAVERLFGGTGEWQRLEIDVSGDQLAVQFNGTEVTRTANVLNSPGYIGVQGESGVVEYRSIEIRETLAADSR
jgi:hypothetical protein